MKYLLALMIILVVALAACATEERIEPDVPAERPVEVPEEPDGITFLLPGQVCLTLV